MKMVLITRDEQLATAARSAYAASDQLIVFEDWAPALDACIGAKLLFVDLVATLDEPHKIAGYERFAQAKMGHPDADTVPLVLIAPPADYELDFLTGWPDFVFAHLARPVTDKVFRRASTWV